MIRHLPHALSVARIPTSLAIVALYDPRSPARSWLCLGLALLVVASDMLDGRIARKYALQSKLGYLLDGLGDRAFHVSCVLSLAMEGILSLPIAWILLFREVSQYAVRIIEVDWYSNQSKFDRFVTRSYATILQSSFLGELVRILIAPSPAPLLYIMVINIALLLIAMLSFSRIVPRLWRSWHAAVNG